MVGKTWKCVGTERCKSLAPKSECRTFVVAIWNTKEEAKSEYLRRSYLKNKQTKKHSPNKQSFLVAFLNTGKRNKRPECLPYLLPSKACSIVSYRVTKADNYLTNFHQECICSRMKNTVNQTGYIFQLPPPKPCSDVRDGQNQQWHLPYQPPPKACYVTLRHNESRRALI